MAVSVAVGEWLKWLYPLTQWCRLSIFVAVTTQLWGIAETTYIVYATSGCHPHLVDIISIRGLNESISFNASCLDFIILSGHFVECLSLPHSVNSHFST